MNKIIIALCCIWSATLMAQSAPSLAWNANPPADQVTNYKVYEKVGTVYNLVATVGGSVLTYSLAGVPAGQHTYAVSAVNIAGESSKSAEVILPGTPSVPTGLKINP